MRAISSTSDGPLHRQPRRVHAFIGLALEALLDTPQYVLPREELQLAAVAAKRGKAGR